MSKLRVVIASMFKGWELQGQDFHCRGRLCGFFDVEKKEKLTGEHDLTHVLRQKFIIL